MSFDATLVVMAAGMGSRFGGLKQIEPIGPHGQAIVDFSVYDAKQAGFNKVVFIIKHEIEDEFKKIVGSRIEKMIDVDYAFQEIDMLPEGFTAPADRTKPWGTAHAIYCCRDVVKTPFAVINADDYYGKSAYKKMYNHLKEQKGDFCMVGFRLENTLTENGTVSRGICEVENGVLKSVTERTKIIDCKYTEDDLNWTELPKDSIVSMNMWGFTPDVFGYIEKDLNKFFAEKINEPKVEYYLPTVVSNVIANGQKDVSVLVAEDKWYGVTYKEDKAGVVTALNEKINNGEYEGF
ncbi:MAG: sugar phosphate nucleotidyltransferase [Acutalibacteraceae bacterium]|nr:sugar phosphate nucleotidyltransferase [Acutalibacteraceae bacterium]